MTWPWAQTPCEHVVAVVVADVDAVARTKHVDEETAAAIVLADDDVLVRNALADRVARGLGDEGLPPRLATLARDAIHLATSERRRRAKRPAVPEAEETIDQRMDRLVPSWSSAAPRYAATLIDELPTRPQSFEMREGCAAVYGSTTYQVTVHFVEDVDATLQLLRDRLHDDAELLRRPVQSVKGENP